LNKKLLIISPYFPPVNGADMQRVRMSLPYFAEFGWDAEVATIDPRHADLDKDNLLLQSIPSSVKVHQVQALSKPITKVFGLGSIALRSLWFYRQKVNELLKNGRFDLIYFSTTQFPVCILGAYWKKKFGIPYVIDLQDPWHSDYYRDKPKAQQPAKFWLSYRLNRYLEPKAMETVDGLVSVSAAYIDTLKSRYPVIKDIPSATIPFGFFEPDMAIAEANKSRFAHLLDPDTCNIVYVGRGGADLHAAIGPVFKALRATLEGGSHSPKPLRFYFIGTSYAPGNQGRPSIIPLAKQYGVEAYVQEITGRISFYHALLTLQQADALFIPGSDDPKYTASKIYPYLHTRKPLLAIFNKLSPAIRVLKACGVKDVYDYDQVTGAQILHFLNQVATGFSALSTYAPEALAKYSARQMAYNQCTLFSQVIYGKN
jgi:hypothetical protein